MTAKNILRTLFVVITTGFALIILTGSYHLIIQQYANPPNILSIAWQGEQYLWTSDPNQLVRWDVQSGEKDVFKGISGDLWLDNDNNLWVIDANRINRFDGYKWTEFTPDDGFIGTYAYSLSETERYIWLGTYGLSRFDKKNESWKVVLDNPPGPPVPTPQYTPAEVLMPGVHAILPDDEAIWIGTNRGLTRIQEGKQETWDNETLETKGVRCLARTTEDTLWVCSDRGVGIWDGFQWQNFQEMNEPLSIILGKEGEFWVTTWDSGVAHWDGESWHQWDSYDGLAGVRAKSLVISKTDDNVWVGTEKGISRWDGDVWNNYNTSDGLTSDYVNVLYQDPSGKIWAGTNSGLNYYNPDTDRWYPFPDNQ